MPEPARPSLHLIGGGWDEAAAASCYGPFLDRAGSGAPVVACVVLDEGDGIEQFARWDAVLRRTARCEPVPVLVPIGGVLRVDDLASADALLVCGGLTPDYAAALAPQAAAVRDWLVAGDRPYAGFSAGAAIAPSRALVGGWRAGGVPVCPEDAAEDLDEVTVTAGLGLLDLIVDVHCAQWGTLPRLIAAVSAAAVGTLGLAIDENTAVHLEGGHNHLSGTGAVRLVHPGQGGDGVTVTTLRADRGGVSTVELPAGIVDQMPSGVQCGSRPR